MDIKIFFWVAVGLMYAGALIFLIAFFKAHIGAGTFKKNGPPSNTDNNGQGGERGGSASY